ncbi:hypothetical protein [Actinoplanes sp. DH11]|uniref:hypothetical protein n=1 Tax=Actinoplanes sp. DH11 TaxID=2857011 RepID=UPI001E49A753|nr:hypothetical protein [Actinoplanes sp. DH11]
MPIRSLAVMEALDRWADFPVHREPRPIVLSAISTDDWLRANPGWRADLTGPGVVLPAEDDLPPSLLAAALAYCEGLRLPPGRRLGPLIRGDGPFGTDRGVQLLPAWMMVPDGRRSPFIAMDPHFEHNHTWWPPGLRTTSSQPASLAADGRTLTFRFAAHPGVDYPGAKVHETATAVLIEPVGIRQRDASLDYIYDREMLLRLNAPLGNRVLISTGHGHGHGHDTCGAPTMVIASGTGGSAATAARARPRPDSGRSRRDARRRRRGHHRPGSAA